MKKRVAPTGVNEISYVGKIIIDSSSSFCVRDQYQWMRFGASEQRTHAVRPRLLDVRAFRSACPHPQLNDSAGESSTDEPAHDTAREVENSQEERGRFGKGRHVFLFSFVRTGISGWDVVSCSE